MTRYRDDLACPVAFAEQNIEETVAEVVAAQGLRQLHIAETEKYAHVTYFLNGGREQEFGGEVRILVPSPKDVATYDLKPEMSAAEVTRRFEEEIGTGGYRFVIVNFANPDMVGHTGVDPRSDQSRRDGRRVPGPCRRGRACSGAGRASSSPTMATRSRCSSRTASARTRRTRRTRCRCSSSPKVCQPELASGRVAASRTSPRRASG